MEKSAPVTLSLPPILALFLLFFLWKKWRTKNNSHACYNLDKNMETFNDVISADRLVLVDFFATWCGPCKAMHPVLENLKQQLGERLRIIKVDVDKYQQTAAQYGVQAVPTLMLFRSGRQLWRQSGALPLPQLMTVVNSYL